MGHLTKEIVIHKKLYNESQHLITISKDDFLVHSIESFTFSSFQKLKRLDLSNNCLSLIGHNTFAGLSDLLELNLENNLIEFLHNDSFKGLENLKSLNIASR